jgi:hypothetical protein
LNKFLSNLLKVILNAYNIDNNNKNDGVLFQSSSPVILVFKYPQKKIKKKELKKGPENKKKLMKTMLHKHCFVGYNS